MPGDQVCADIDGEFTIHGADRGLESLPHCTHATLEMISVRSAAILTMRWASTLSSF